MAQICMSRITYQHETRRFANGKNIFYIEYRCPNVCEGEKDICEACTEKRDTSVIQWVRKLDHGRIDRPISDRSHIYGGSWYLQAVEKYGKPSNESIQYAIQRQLEARTGILFAESDVKNAAKKTTNESSKAEVRKENQEMPRAQKTENTTTEAKSVQRKRKPKVAAISTEVISSEPNINAAPAPAPAPATTATATNALETPVKTRSRKPKANPKPQTSPYTSVIASTPELVHKEVALPTHIESLLEEFDSDGYRIEYVKLSLFELNGSAYYRDMKKNKLYKKVRNTVGAYVGRYNPDFDTIDVSVPDSDDEE